MHELMIGINQSPKTEAGVGTKSPTYDAAYYENVSSVLKQAGDSLMAIIQSQKTKAAGGNQSAFDTTIYEANANTLNAGSQPEIGTPSVPVVGGSAVKGSTGYLMTTSELPDSYIASILIQSDGLKNLIPTVGYYYTTMKVVESVPCGKVWVSTDCCFHDSTSHSSLCINMITGNYFCRKQGCKKGGNIIDFHMQHKHVDLIDALSQLKQMRMDEVSAMGGTSSCL